MAAGEIPINEFNVCATRAVFPLISLIPASVMLHRGRGGRNVAGDTWGSRAS